MLETRAVIVQVDGPYALVRAEQTGSCKLCKGEGCGSAKLSRLFCNKPRQFQVNNPINAGVGDEVVVSTAEGAVLRGIGLVYLMPLLCMVIGAMLGGVLAQSAQHDGSAATGALAGLVAGFLLVKRISIRQSGRDAWPYVSRQWQDEQG